MAELTPKKVDCLKVSMDTDGCGTVRNGKNSHHYAVTLESCTCYDWVTKGGSYQAANGRRFCKHMFVLARRTPCPRCAGVMVLNVQPVGANVFECDCGWVIDAATVLEDRETCAVREVAA